MPYDTVCEFFVQIRSANGEPSIFVQPSNPIRCSYVIPLTTANLIGLNFDYPFRETLTPCRSTGTVTISLEPPPVNQCTEYSVFRIRSNSGDARKAIKRRGL